MSYSNRAIVSEWVAVETYKSASLRAIQENMKVLCSFPGQVVVLRPTADVIRIQGTRGGDPGCLVDVKQTKGFERFCDNLAQANVEMLTGLVGQADQVLFDSRSGVESFRDGLQELLASAAADLRTWRKTGELSEHVGSILARGALELAAILFDAFTPNRRPSFEDLPAYWLFWYAVAGVAYGGQFVGEGGLPSRTYDRILNDILDLRHVAFGLLFDGVMSKDRRVLECYENSIRIGDILFC